MKRSALDAIAVIASAAPLALSQVVWLVSAEGLAAGGQIFAWLWLPPVLSVITLLLTTRTQRVGRILRAVLAVSNLGWAALIAVHDWTKTAYVLDMSTQHSGIEILVLTEVSLTPTVWIAVGALLGSSVLWTAASLTNPHPSRPEAKAQRSQDSEPISQDSDPRNLWEEQAG